MSVTVISSGLLLALCTHITNAAVTTQATFSNYLGNALASKDTAYDKKVGYVAIYANLVWYDLDFSAIDWTQFDSNCTEDLSFHIHDKWTYGDTAQSIGQGSADRIGIECHENFTGRHFDPWMACGPTSGNAECLDNGGCIPPSSVYEDSEFYIDQYSCDPENFDLIAYACEVGDLSGKYGTILAMEWDNTTNETVGVHTWDLHGSYWEVQETVLAPGLDNNLPAQFSLVIHCGDADGEPLFCAPIVRENEAAIPPFDFTDPDTIEMDFSDAGSDYENLTITFTNEGITFNVPARAGALCNEWSLELYQEWPFYEEGVTALENCDTELLGGIYDPTHTCIADSGSLYCQDGVRCPDQTNISVTYECIADDNYQGCAVGDIFSRIGPIVPDFTINADVWTSDPFIITANSPPLFILNQRGVVLTCLDGNNATLNETENICAGTACDNCTETLAPVDTRPPTAETSNPTASPTNNPTTEPTVEPTSNPTYEPTYEPTAAPTDEATADAAAIAGVVVGVVVFLALVAIILWLCVVRARKKEAGDEGASEQPQAETEQQVEMN